MKTTKISSLVFQNDYNTPQNRILKVYNVQLEDGTTGNTYLKPDHNFKEGSEVDYELSNGKIKLSEAQSQNSSQKSNPSNNQHTITYYLGYAYGYAKDIAIAEANLSKSKQVDTDRLKQLAEEIYNHMGKLFNP